MDWALFVFGLGVVSSSGFSAAAPWFARGERLSLARTIGERLSGLLVAIVLLGFGYAQIRPGAFGAILMVMAFMVGITAAGLSSLALLTSRTRYRFHRDEE